MADIFTKEKRSEIMSRVKNRDTTPEKIVRRLLHHLGYRFRLNVSKLPGKPDIVLARHRKIIFVNGCFWHGHKRCKRGKRPFTNKLFWNKKINSNIERDNKVRRRLNNLGWKVLVVWECQTRDINILKSKLSSFMKG